MPADGGVQYSEYSCCSLSVSEQCVKNDWSGKRDHRNVRGAELGFELGLRRASPEIGESDQYPLISAASGTCRLAVDDRCCGCCGCDNYRHRDGRGDRCSIFAFLLFGPCLLRLHWLSERYRYTKSSHSGKLPIFPNELERANVGSLSSKTQRRRLAFPISRYRRCANHGGQASFPFSSQHVDRWTDWYCSTSHHPYAVATSS